MLDRIAALRPTGRRTLIVAIDGFGGSGKSTLARALQSRLHDATVVHTDDFARPHVLGWEWERMKTQVLDPLDRDRPGEYRRYDWDRDALAEWHEVPVGGILIVEGVASMRQELGKYWDFSIWVACSRELRLARGVARDGQGRRAQWEEVWIPEEDRYVAVHAPDRRADVVVSGEAPFVL